MPSALRNPKTLSGWLDLDYVRRPRLLGRLWLPASGAAVLLAGLCVAVGFLPGGERAFQAGPVSTKHALFANDCGVCHKNAFGTLGRLAWSDPEIRTVPDTACTACHSGAIHHATQVGGQSSCASCHKEHRGHAALARIADARCTACHADLKRNDDKPTDFEPHVTGFAPGLHPEFRLWAQGTPADPGTIRFNHAAHLVEGLLAIDQVQLERQRVQAEKQGCMPPERAPRKGETITCQSCHEPDATGRGMKPIRYEPHCQRCHPLGVQLHEVGTDRGLRALARSFAQTPAPHPAPAQTAEVVRGVLRERLSRFIQDNHKAFLGGPRAAEPEGRGGFLFPSRDSPLTKEEFAWVGRQQAGMEQLLFDGGGGCRYCHTESTPAKGPRGLPAYKPSAIPDRWFAHAAFDHKSHRMLACGECHEASTSTGQGDVLLPKVDSCMKCHQSNSAGARAECVTCHVYHDRKEQDLFRGGLKMDRILGR